MIYDEESPSVQQYGLNLRKEKPITRPPAGFSESFLQEFAFRWREEQTVSRSRAMERARASEYVEQLRALHEGRERAPRGELELFSDIKEENRILRAEREAALENQTAMGKVGGFIGTALGLLSDPVNLMLLPFGATWASGVVRTMVTEAGIAMATEAAIQPFVYQYKKDLESPYSLGEALTNIGTAGIGAGALSGIVKGAARGVRKLGGFDELLEKAAKVENPTQEQRAAIETLQNYTETLRQSPFEPHPVGDELHLRATQKASDDIANGRPVDVSEFIEQPGERVRIIKERPAPRVARESQTLGEYIRNSGGVSIELAGNLKGEYAALYESGGRRAGTVKKKAGLSPDTLAQRAHDAGYIDEPDPYLLKEALERDAAGEKVYSLKSDRFERKLELEIDREFEEFARIMEEVNAAETQGRIARGRRVQRMLEAEDVQIPVDVEGGGTAMRSAREAIAEIEGDARAAVALRACLTR